MISLTIGGLATGAIYGLVAIGVVTIFRATSHVNFAQGEVLALGAYAYWVSTQNIGTVGQLVVVLAVGALIGVFLYALTHYLMPKADELGVVIATLGLSIIIVNILLLTYGEHPRRVGGWITGEATIGVGGGAVIPSNHLMIIGMALLATGALHYWFRATSLGKSVRAAAENPVNAALSGISVGKARAVSWVLGCSFASLGGLLLAPAVFVYPTLGAAMLFKGFTAAAVGGFNSILGAMAGGLILGLLEAYSTKVISGDFRDLVAFAALLLVLLFRPRGLFGGAATREV